MKLYETLSNRIPEVTPAMVVLQRGEMYKPIKHNFNGNMLDRRIEVKPIVRMWTDAKHNEIHYRVDQRVVIIDLLDGCQVTSLEDAYDVYRMQRRQLTSKLAQSSIASPSSIRDYNNLDT